MIIFDHVQNMHLKASALASFDTKPNGSSNSFTPYSGSNISGIRLETWDHGTRTAHLYWFMKHRCDGS